MVATTRRRTALTMIRSEKSSRSKAKEARAASRTTAVWRRAETAWNSDRRRRTTEADAALKFRSPLEVDRFHASTWYWFSERVPD